MIIYNKIGRKEIVEKIEELLRGIHDELQSRPNQYVVGYYKVSDCSLIGYHTSTFCQITKDIMDGKRYAGLDPTSRLMTISDNLKYTLSEKSDEGMFGEIYKHIKEDFGGLKAEEIYLDPVYLADGMPKQQFRYIILGNTGEE